MSTCAKRSVVQVGDRPARVNRLALQVQSNARQMTPRVLPATGGYGMPMGGITRAQPYMGRPLNGIGTYDPVARAITSIGQMGREIADTFRTPQGPIGHSGGRAPSNGVGNGFGTGGSIGGGTDAGGGNTSGTYTEGRMVVVTFQAPYTEPMAIPNAPAGFRPLAIIAARIFAPTDPARFFRSGVGCDWYANGLSRIVLRSIDGMTIGDPTVLHYTFIYYGVQS